jgi:hypothetical protein
MTDDWQCNNQSNRPGIANQLLKKNIPLAGTKYWPAGLLFCGCFMAGPFNQAKVIASEGQVSAASWQSQVSHLSSALTNAFSSLPSSNTSGQSSTHVAQPVHAS